MMVFENKVVTNKTELNFSTARIRFMVEERIIEDHLKVVKVGRVMLISGSLKKNIIYSMFL